SNFEKIAVGNNQIGHLTDVDRPQTVGHIYYLSRIEGDRLQRIGLGEPKSRRHSGVLRKVSHLRSRITGGYAVTHAGLLKFRSVFIQGVVSIVFANRQGKYSGEDYGNILLFQQTRDFPRIVAAENNRLQLHLFGKLNGATNLGFSFRTKDYGQFTTNVRHERLEHDILFRTRQRLVRRVRVLRAAISLGVVQHLANLFDLALVRRQRFGEICGLLLLAAKATAATSDARIVDHKSELRHDRHLLWRRAE